MNLKHRLSFYSVTVFSIVILVASAAIYFSFYKKMEHNELLSLKNKTLLAAIYYLEADETGVVERETVIDQLRKSISRSNIAVFNDKNILVRGEMNASTDISTNFLNKVRSQHESNYITKDFFYNGLFYKDNEGDFVVITRESKSEFNQQLLTLLQILTIVFLVGIVMVYIFSNLLGKFAFQPLTNIIDQIKERDNVNFSKPLQTKDSYTEIQDLVKSYNHFMERIDKTFIIQKNFIDYVSHELRTPITALLLTLEVTHNKDRTKEEYQQVLNQLNQYVVDLEETLDNMMLLSGAKTKFEFTKIHIDEIIWQVIEQMILYHNAQIEVNILVKNSDFLIINGNPQLLQLALNNIIENAIKYSDNQPIKILFEDKNNHLEISVFDTGIGIPLEDVPNITANFFRGQNTQYYTGKGIGLSMANIIFTLHNIQLQLKNNQPKGTIAKLSFPKND
ncbi:sensor histidine kinase [Flavobacterium sp. I3-2]|uniref:sensor histidine kinase n=1 Tax=Flavobacterium sp. I3-2 TaxID=2748319 RepID=UPI0015A7A0E5|nr:HAMP domain-containing sensor histidine kinase [Flavobacterium sp. I3-2]